jgi:hypothetical protein
VRVRDASAGQADTDRVSAGLARVGLPSRVIVITYVRVMVSIN